MRHGRSRANEAGLIVSDPNEGCEDWGLAEGAGAEIVSSVAASGLPQGIMVVSSPFLRTRETADIAARILRSPPVGTVPGFRERYFGDWDLGSDDRYPEVWAADSGNPDNTAGGVESPASVLARFLEAVDEIGRADGPADVLIVSHGDPLNILLAYVEGFGPEEHRRVAGMKTAEIRPLPLRGASSHRSGNLYWNS